MLTAKKKIATIALISTLTVIMLTGTKILNVAQINEEGHADSCHDLSAVIYVISGFLLCLVAFWTYKINIMAGIIPWGLGSTLLIYGLYICYVKGMIG